MLFMLVGVIYEKAHHRWIFYPDDYKDPSLAGKPGFGGIGAQMPIFTAFVAFAFFAGLGLPALSGFISEALCFIGGFSVFRTLTIIGTLGILLNAVYFLRAYQHVFLGPLNEKYKDYTDMSTMDLAIVIPLAVIILFLGVYPAPLIDMIAPTLDALIQKIQSAF
jgi:NADH-quinone oxidoreductase subunit M